MNSLEKIVDKIEEIIDNNLIYNSFGEGNIWELEGNTNISYPMVWLDADTIPHNIQEGMITYNFDVYFLDLVDADESNELRIKSDTMRSAIDFVKYLKTIQEDFYIQDDKTVNAQVFTEQWNDKLSGTKLTIAIDSRGSGDSCKNIFTY